MQTRIEDHTRVEINQKTRAKTSEDRDAMAVETKAVVASDVGAGAGASEAVTETETANIITVMKAKSFFIESMNEEVAL
ncbi:hypothetical protein E3N88_24365 [Mikania micrantha]|uniref:Uncharacterized protein n=1 Tax=Mikania micrantha TaxID=192012 RepID=A0A5N6N290_9ASTR|nr:hypothetical protein E3N88_24365 [Mikania micrantha]